MRLPHDPDAVARLRAPTPEDPWRVLLSGCLAGWACGVEGTDYGLRSAAPAWLPQVTVIPFCPEDVGLGTPRVMPDIHGGDGFDVLDGRARVLAPDGADLTEGMLRGARAMLEHALRARVDMAVLTDMSAACGSQVISLGCRLVERRAWQKGVGVATAMLLRAGIPVVSQRDFRTLARLHQRLDPAYGVPEGVRDHHEHPWVLANLTAS
jgi:uncharacterized protein YbbK (DUF523 family)